jgi:hypothetical protein
MFDLPILLPATEYTTGMAHLKKPKAKEFWLLIQKHALLTCVQLEECRLLRNDTMWNGIKVTMFPSTAVLIMHLNTVFVLRHKDILIYIIFITNVFILTCNAHFCSSKTVHLCTFTSYRYVTIPLKIPRTEISFSFVAMQQWKTQLQR